MTSIRPLPQRYAPAPSRTGWRKCSSWTGDRRTARTALAVAILLLAMGLRPAWSQPVRGLWMRPPATVEAAASVVGLAKRAGVNVIFLQVFYDGQTAYPSRVAPPLPAYTGPDRVAAVVAAAHGAGLQVYAAMNVLYWQGPGVASPLVAAHPEWRELNAEGQAVDDAGRPGGAFVSPVAPQVAGVLQQLVAEMGTQYGFDGLALDYLRFSAGDFLGYASIDRQAFLAEHHMDALDIDPLGFATSSQEQDLLGTWQENQISALGESLASAFRRVAPQGKVAVTITPGYYRGRVRNPVRQDWQSWVTKGWVDMVIPQGLVYTPQLQENPFAALNLPATVVNAPAVVPDFAARTGSAGSQVGALRRLGVGSYVLWAPVDYARRDQMLRDLVRGR